MSCKIMVVDDEYLPRQNILNMLNWEKYGFEIMGEATNATQALALLKEEKPDVMLCDIVMPYIDGIELSKTVKRLYPEIEIVILSGYDNFDYVKTAFKYGVTDYILKPTLDSKQLLDILNPIKARRGQKTDIVDFASSEEEFSTELLRIFEERGLVDEVLDKRFSYSEYTLITYGIRYTNDIDLNCLDEKATKIFGSYQFLKIKLCEEANLIILNHEYEDRFRINIKWDEFTRYLDAKDNKLYGIKVDAIHNAEELSEGYGDIKRLARQHFYGHTEMFRNLHVSEVPKLKEENIDFSAFMERADSNSPSIALNYLKQFLEGLGSDSALSVHELKATVQNCTYNIINMIQVSEDYYGEVNEYKINFLNNVSRAKDIEELKGYFYDIDTYLNNLIDNMGITDKIMERVSEYIHENFGNQISLQMIANELYISYSYLSTYFNNKFNMCFNDYLNQVRIKKAKEYLADKDVQIAYVSHMVGYSSQGYFTKVFKKIVGMTPTKYRKKYGK